MNLNQITIQVSDVEKSIIFYERIGLNLIVRSLPDYARFECPIGDTTLSLHLNNEARANNTWLYFEVADVDQTIKKLQDIGINISVPPEEKLWLWRESRLFDPDGHVIIIYTAGENRKDPPWRL